MRIAIVVPHIFMNRQILPEVIFSPAHLALDLAEGLRKLNHEVTLFTPGTVDTKVKNITADLTLFEEELKLRGDSYTQLLKKHPLIFITLSRQVQAELVAKAYTMASENLYDIVHIYTNEEELALEFSNLCTKPVCFTHHEPYNFMVKYRSLMPKHKEKNWISISKSQQKTMEPGANFVGNIYHGLPKSKFAPNLNPSGNYFAYFGRIIQPKGVHLAIQAAKKSGVELRIAGKHYAGYSKDKYWNEVIEPEIDNKQIKYIGFLKTDKQKQDFLGNATALIVPSVWDEPFGMVMIEALACATPIIGIKSGAIPEVVDDLKTGILVENNASVVKNLSKAINTISTVERKACRTSFEKRFLVERMCKEHEKVYKQLVGVN